MVKVYFKITFIQNMCLAKILIYEDNKGVGNGDGKSTDNSWSQDIMANAEDSGAKNVVYYIWNQIKKSI